jgi:hypothetical protein
LAEEESEDEDYVEGEEDEDEEEEEEEDEEEEESSNAVSSTFGQPSFSGFPFGPNAFSFAPTAFSFSPFSYAPFVAVQCRECNTAGMKIESEFSFAASC